MPLFKKKPHPSPEEIDEAIGRARTAWDAGNLCFVYKPITPTSFDEQQLNVAVDGLLRIGWTLQDTALTFDSTFGTSRGNREMAIFTFVRAKG